MSSPACNVVAGDYGGVDVCAALCVAVGASSGHVVGCCIDGGWQWLDTIRVVEVSGGCAFVDNG